MGESSHFLSCILKSEQQFMELLSEENILELSYNASLFVYKYGLMHD